jgi:hypothetical protein
MSKGVNGRRAQCSTIASPADIPAMWKPFLRLGMSIPVPGWTCAHVLRKGPSRPILVSRQPDDSQATPRADPTARRRKTPRREDLPPFVSSSRRDDPKNLSPLHRHGHKNRRADYEIQLTSGSPLPAGRNHSFPQRKDNPDDCIAVSEQPRAALNAASGGVRRYLSFKDYRSCCRWDARTLLKTAV